MKAPLAQLTKPEILKLYRWKCKHGHNGITHYNCYRAESVQPERVGFLDIEASNLKANFGIMLSYCIKPADGGSILKGVLTKADLMSGSMDKRIVADCIQDMYKFDRLVGHYASRFDFPFLRTRALIHKLKFPNYGDILQTDTWRMAKNTLCLHSNRQAVIVESLAGKTLKTRILQKYWINALQGDEKALTYILKHNIADVIDLEKTYNYLVSYCRRTHSSI